MASIWHPCADGLIPIADAMSEFTRAPVATLPDDLQRLRSTPSYRLSERIFHDGHARPTGDGNRLETLRRWLQFNGYAPDADETSGRVHAFLSKLRDWEEKARETLRARKRECDDLSRSGVSVGPRERFGSDVCDEYDEIVDEACGVAGYLRQLASMLAATILAKQSSIADAAARQARPETDDGVDTGLEEELRSISSLEKSGDYWRLRFVAPDGSVEHTAPLQNRLGFEHIYKLIYEPATVADLFPTVPLSIPVAVTDKRTLAQVRAEIDRLKEARPHAEPDLISDIDEQIANGENHLREATRPGGKIKTFATEYERAVNRFRNAIRGVVQRERRNRS